MEQPTIQIPSRVDVSPGPFSSVRDDSSHQRALSFFQDLLEQEDEHGSADSSSFSFGELLAYRAKVSEIAALLKEDSPSLSLKWSLTNHGGAQASATEKDTSISPYPLDGEDPGFLCNSAAKLMNGRQRNLGLTSLPGNVRRDSALFKKKSLSILERFDTQDIDDGVSASGLQSHHSLPRWDALKAHRDASKRKPISHNQSDTVLGKATSNEHSGSGMGRIRQVYMSVDLNDLLIGCGRAVATDNTKWAMEIVSKVKQHASPHGNGAERLAYYFVEALHARFSGTAWPLYTGLLNPQRFSIREVLKAHFVYLETCPFAKASYAFANQTILKVAKGATKLHIIEHQITSYRYLSLFKDLATLPGGPPMVHVVGLVVPHYSMLPCPKDVFVEELERIGRRLCRYAASCGVPFHFTPWVGTRETIRLHDFVSPQRNPDEVLVMISACFVRFVMDDVLDQRAVRVRNLKMARNMNPDVFIQGVITGSYNAPFYWMRFKEALFHFASVYELLNTFLEEDSAVRIAFESEVLGKAILNIVACEGRPVSQRVDKYKQWQAITEEVGLRQLPLDKEIVGKVRDVLKSWHKEYTIAEDSKYLLMGWKGRMLYATSAWKSPTTIPA